MNEINLEPGTMIEVCFRHRQTQYLQTVSGSLVSITPDSIAISEDFLRETYTVDKNGQRHKTFVDTTETISRKLEIFEVLSIKTLK